MFSLMKIFLAFALELSCLNCRQCSFVGAWGQKQRTLVMSIIRLKKNYVHVLSFFSQHYTCSKSPRPSLSEKYMFVSEGRPTASQTDCWVSPGSGTAISMRRQKVTITILKVSLSNSRYKYFWKKSIAFSPIYVHQHSVCRKIWVVLTKDKDEVRPRHSVFHLPPQGSHTHRNWLAGWHTKNTI